MSPRVTSPAWIARLHTGSLKALRRGTRAPTTRLEVVEIGELGRLPLRQARPTPRPRDRRPQITARIADDDASMATMRLRVELDKTFLERLRTSPRKAISELMWNALDADAEMIKVDLGVNEVGGVTTITVTDDGHGMTADEARQGFGRLGGSWKAAASETRSKRRALHGREGRGRFLAAKIAGRARWMSVARSTDGEHRKTVVEIYRRTLDDVEIRDEGTTDEPTGTVVMLSDFDAPPTGLGGSAVADRLTGEFALYLTKYPVKLTYDGFAIDPKALQASTSTYELETPDESDAHLDVVEWVKPMERRLFVCDDNGTALSELLPGVQAAGFEFTAYVRWDGFIADAALDLAELSAGPTADVIEAARDKLREHFRERAQHRRREVIEAWKQEKVYPYEEPPSNEVERTSRELFDVIAFTARDAVGGNNHAQRFALRLLREALERDPGHLRRVLEEVLELDPARLADLNQLLDRTTLAAIVSAARSITDRLDFLRALHEIIFEREIQARLLERSQLHRILATETWLFGEEYHLVADDESLTNVLRRHLRCLERDAMAAENVTDEHGRTRIVDLMLAKSLEHSANRRGHVVIELKRPSVSIGHKEVAQIRDYAQAVADDAQFDKTATQWDFWVVSTDMDDAIKRQANQRNREPGLLDDYEGVNVRIWAKTWGQIIQDATHRLKFVRQQLEYTSGRDQAIQYLHERHRDYVPDPLPVAETPAADTPGRSRPGVLETAPANGDSDATNCPALRGCERG
jgi:hypothetical protein